LYSVEIYKGGKPLKIYNETKSPPSMDTNSTYHGKQLPYLTSIKFGG
jgi:hypothetical protein